MKELAITAVNCITDVGHDGAMTAAAVRAGISRMAEHEEYLDGDDNPITVARIRGIEEGKDTAQRMASTAAFCLKNLIDNYFQNGTRRPSQIHLFLGASSEERPGPRYEESCMYPLQRIVEKWADKPDLQAIPQGNASIQYAMEKAGKLIENDPTVLCIIGGIDSLIRDSTLNWFEQNDRLKSISYGRQQGLIAGEAVGFMSIEDPARARQAHRPILARITGLGLTEEPTPRAANATSWGSGLTDACRKALDGGKDKDIRAVFGDLNGENPRALEWCKAESRCFKSRDHLRQLWTPANCYGDIGAASGAVLAVVAAQGLVRGWLKGPVLTFCSDDHGSCGAMVLEKGSSQ
jgi:3-oxoacyl-[acyl-carrier-protein] synthase-1